jgi:hypothetical protein
MDLNEATAHAERWINAWNAHDIEAVLAGYADDIVLHSPRAASWDPSRKDGAIRGKAALRAYFEAALQRFPALRMTLLSVYADARDGVIVEYINSPTPGTELYVLERARMVNGLMADVESAYGVERTTSPA